MTTHLSFRQGVQECIPTLLGYAGVGISFGHVNTYFIVWNRNAINSNYTFYHDFKSAIA